MTLRTPPENNIQRANPCVAFFFLCEEAQPLIAVLLVHVAALASFSLATGRARPMPPIYSGRQSFLVRRMARVHPDDEATARRAISVR